MSRLPRPEPGRAVVISDGAWGTEFQKRGLRPGEPADAWNLDRPGDVVAIARGYVEAGSRVILTNTFRANPLALAAQATPEQVERINLRGVELSREAAGSRAAVFASIGPTGKLLASGEIDADGVCAALGRQITALAAADPDALLLETFSDIEEARLAAELALATGRPVVVSFAFDSGKNKDRTLTGATPEQAARAMAAVGVDAVGANCGAGPDAFLAVTRRLREAAPGLPVWIKPNAGLPTIVAGQMRYDLAPAAFAASARGLIDAGASFLGGCCGTSPEFVRALVEALAP